MKKFPVILIALLLLLTGQIATTEESSILDLPDRLDQKESRLTEQQTGNHRSDGIPIPDFDFVDLQGKTHKLSEYRGKWLVVNYWAIYCPPCRVEVYDLDRFSRKHADRAVVLGMDAGGSSTEELTAFKQEFKLGYDLIPAQENTLLGFGIIDAIPTTFVVDPKGNLVDRHIGLITYNDLSHFVEQGVPKSSY